MRRKDREITDYQKILQIVSSCDCCRIGLVDGGEPYIVPLNFGWEDRDGRLVLYFHSAAEGRKIDLIPRQSLAAFEMDTSHRLSPGGTACQFSYLYQCVMGKGRIEILREPAEKIYGLQKIMAHYTDKTDWDFPAATLDRIAVLRLEVCELSCKEHA